MDQSLLETPSKRACLLLSGRVRSEKSFLCHVGLCEMHLATSTYTEVILKVNVQRNLLAAMLGGILAGAYPFAIAQTTTGQTGPAATSGSSSASGQSAQSNRSATSGANATNDEKAIQNLRSAAQALRESIQTLARMPAGEQRTEAIKEGNEALFRVQSAMAALPPELLTANANESNFKKSLDKMKTASDRLYSAADALANQPAGKARNDAVKQVNQALLQTNEAMLTGLQLYAANDKSGSTRSSSSGSSGMASNTDSGKPPMTGSAAVTGRPGGNTVDLGGSAGNSGVGTGTGTSTGAAGASNQRSNSGTGSSK